LADHLRETGLDAVIVDGAESPIAGVGRETWGGVRDERGVVAAYGIPVDENLAQRLAEIWSQATETWTTLEFGGTAAHPTVAAACALRSAEPVRGVPVSGLMALRGVQRPVLTAMEPCAVDGLDVPKAPMTNLDRLDWPGGSTNDLSRT
jgi:type VII secretion protein EccE